MFSSSSKVTLVVVESILLSSEYGIYQHYAFMIVVMSLLLHLLKQVFMPDLCWALGNPGYHLNFTIAL